MSKSGSNGKTTSGQTDEYLNLLEVFNSAQFEGLFSLKRQYTIENPLLNQVNLVIPNYQFTSYNFEFPDNGGTVGQVLASDGPNMPYIWVSPGTGGIGTVTSVGLTAPSIFTVTNSPITTSGTISLSYSGVPLPISNGGTGATSATGTGLPVLQTSPTLITPTLGAAHATSLILSTPLATTSGGTGLATIGTSGQVLQSNGTSLTYTSPGSGGIGTVTSVGMTVPNYLNVTPATITTSGTFSVTGTSTGSENTTTSSYNVVLDTNPTITNPLLNYYDSSNELNMSIGSESNEPFITLYESGVPYFELQPTSLYINQPDIYIGYNPSAAPGTITETLYLWALDNIYMSAGDSTNVSSTLTMSQTAITLNVPTTGISSSLKLQSAGGDIDGAIIITTLAGAEGDISITTAAAASGNITLTSGANAASNITLEAAGGAQGGITLKTQAAATSDISLSTLAAVSGNILLTTGAAANSNIILTSSGGAEGGITLTTTSGAAGNIVITTAAGASGNVEITAGGGADSQVIITSGGGAEGGINIQTAAGAEGDITLTTADGVSGNIALTTGAAVDSNITLTAAGGGEGGIFLTTGAGGEGDISLTAGAAGAGSVTITSAAAGDGAVVISAAGGGGGQVLINATGTDGLVTLTAEGGGAEIALNAAGAGSSISISSESGAGEISITGAAGAGALKFYQYAADSLVDIRAIGGDTTIQIWAEGGGGAISIIGVGASVDVQMGNNVGGDTTVFTATGNTKFLSNEGNLVFNAPAAGAYFGVNFGGISPLQGLGQFKVVTTNGGGAAATGNIFFGTNTSLAYEGPGNFEVDTTGGYVGNIAFVSKSYVTIQSGATSGYIDLATNALSSGSGYSWIYPATVGYAGQVLVQGTTPGTTAMQWASSLNLNSITLDGIGGAESGKVTLSAADAVQTYTIMFPVDAPTAGFYLETDGSGNLSWTDTPTFSSMGIQTGLTSGGPIVILSAADVTTGYNWLFPATIGTANQVLSNGPIPGTSPLTWVNGGGTVTSIGITVPAAFSVSPATITSSGTFAITYSGTAIPVANGGTGVTTSTGTGANVQANSPTLVTPTIGAATATSLTTNTLASTSNMMISSPYNVELDSNGLGYGILIGYNTPLISTQNYMFTVFNNSTSRTELFGVTAAGSSSGVTQITLNAPLNVGSSGVGTSGQFLISNGSSLPSWLSTIPVSAGGTGATANTGTGLNVLQTSPSLITPALGVASATSLSTNTITSTGNMMISSPYNVELDCSSGGSGILIGYNTPLLTTENYMFFIYNNSTSRTALFGVTAAGSSSGVTQITLNAPLNLGTAGIGTSGQTLVSGGPGNPPTWVTGSGGSFNPAVPGPIGGTTPSSATFTTVVINTWIAGSNSSAFVGFDNFYSSYTSTCTFHNNISVPTLTATTSVVSPIVTTPIINYAGNLEIDTSTANTSVIVGYNTPKYTAASETFQVYNNSTDRNLLFYVQSAGTSSGSNAIVANVPINVTSVTASGTVYTNTVQPSSGSNIACNGNFTSTGTVYGATGITSGAALSGAYLNIDNTSYSNYIGTNYGLIGYGNGALNFGIGSINGAQFCTFYNSSNVAIGSIYESVGSTTVFSTTSDYRIKDNVKPIANPISRLKKFKPISFNFKNQTEVIEGFIAHEFQELLPYAVVGEKDGKDYQSMDNSFIIPLLTASVQEQQKEIETLKSYMNMLVDEITLLKQKTK